MDTASAVRTRVVHIRAALSPGEIAQLDQLYAAIRAEEAASSAAALLAADNVIRSQAQAEPAPALAPEPEPRSGGDVDDASSLSPTKWVFKRLGPAAECVTAPELAAHVKVAYSHPNFAEMRDSTHLTVFLHKQQRIQRELPHIFDKVLGLMRTADSWGLLSAAGPGVEVRVCEYHDYRPGGALNDNYHSDVGSLITSSILLSAESEFDGGQFTTLEADGTVTFFDDFQRGDALIFVSEKYHSVQLVKSGRRRTLVTELWLPDHDYDYDAVSSGEGSDSDELPPSAPHIVEAARRELHEIYSRFKPERVGRIDRMLQRFSGVEAEFVAEIRAKAARGELGPPAAAATDAAKSTAAADSNGASTRRTSGGDGG